MWHSPGTRLVAEMQQIATAPIKSRPEWPLTATLPARGGIALGPGISGFSKFGHGFVLPPFAYWTPDAFKAKADDARHVIDARCGWDITDFGAGSFDELGLFLFTLRNGRLADLSAGRGMCYAEKLLISRRDQITPMHTHIINDDETDNIFRDPIGRFATIEEDVAPTHLLVSDYSTWLT